MAGRRTVYSKARSVQSSSLPVIHVNETARTTHATRAPMKWQTQNKEVKPFLVLPLLDNERSVSAESKLMKRRTPESTPPSLGLIKRNISAGTETWPPKIKQKKSKKSAEKIERPLTATLERPVLLNINLLNKIDMSLVRKEFLGITNLCKVPLETLTVIKKSATTVKKLKSPTASITTGEQKKRSRKPETSEDSLESDENTNTRTRKMSKINKIVKKSPQVEKNDANNNTDDDNKSSRNISRSSKRSPQLIEAKIIDEVFAGPKANRSLPEPCKTCGRPDQPERFHSHPTQMPRPPKKTEDSPKKQVKSSVQKPVAMKYKPREKSPQKSPVVMPKVVHTPPEATVKKVAKGPQTMVCYLCGREFGTVSLPLHEPKCLQKWERENAQLPRHQQRKAPTKPDKPLTTEEWNKFAWEASQAALTACEHCGRTFLPDRLAVHQRSCRPGTQKVHFQTKSSDSGVNSMSSTPSRAGSESNVSAVSPPPGPPTLQCYVCGRMFGTRSIRIHEPQCLKKWHAHNSNLPPSQRLPPPIKNGESHSGVPPPMATSTTAAPTQTQKDSSVSAAGDAAPISRPASGPRKPMLPCYICGREYGTSSIYIHEPQCLKKWRLENDKLPPQHRRPEPQRPDIKFTPTGQVDYQATNEAIWQTHLNQLVPCQLCGRTFNPERVVVHERSCKGQ